MVKGAFGGEKRKKKSRVVDAVNSSSPFYSYKVAPSLVVALPGERPASGRVREQTRGRQVPQVPFGRALRPPGPKDPAGMLLVSVELGVDEVLQVVLVGGAETLDRTGGFAVAGTDVAGVGEGAVVACAFAEAVEPLSAVGLRTGPFADDDPLVSSCELWAETAGGGDVVRGTHGDLTGREDLVLMGI